MHSAPQLHSRPRSGLSCARVQPRVSSYANRAVRGNKQKTKTEALEPSQWQRSARCVHSATDVQSRLPTAAKLVAGFKCGRRRMSAALPQQRIASPQW